MEMAVRNASASFNRSNKLIDYMYQSHAIAPLDQKVRDLNQTDLGMEFVLT